MAAEMATEGLLKESIESVFTDELAAVVDILSDGAGKPVPKSVAALADPVMTGAVQLLVGNPLSKLSLKSVGWDFFPLLQAGTTRSARTSAAARM
jgi:hypothetical protein